LASRECVRLFENPRARAFPVVIESEGIPVPRRI
jgi:hypothetical protein